MYSRWNLVIGFFIKKLNESKHYLKAYDNLLAMFSVSDHIFDHNLNIFFSDVLVRHILAFVSKLDRKRATMQSFGVVGFISEIQCISGEVLKGVCWVGKYSFYLKFSGDRLSIGKWKSFGIRRMIIEKSKDHGNSWISTLLLRTFCNISYMYPY